MPEIFRQKSFISSEKRRLICGQKGIVLWFTGLSGSGKSTIACETEKRLCESGINTYLLDGDNLRFTLNSDLGFSEEDRQENIRRIAHVAALFAHSGAVAIVSAISPFASGRELARKAAAAMDAAFVEIFVDTPVEVCAQRDTKGLYKRAFAGEIQNFTGISSPYEPPENPEIVIHSSDSTPFDAADEVVRYALLLQSIDKLTAMLCDISLDAGKRIMEIYESGDYSVEKKADDSPLTLADTASNEIICRFLKRSFPHYAILSEESKDSDKRLSNPACFIVDPLDGTKEFIKRNGEFTVNIALSYLNKPVAGVVYAPASGDLYYAAKGFGAYRQDSESSGYFSQGNRIYVSEKTSHLCVMTSRSHSDERMSAILQNNSDLIGSTMCVGSSLKGCMIAAGQAEVYYRPGYTMEWDTAAMQCVVEQAGGVLCQLDGSPMRYNRQNSLNEKGFFILNRIENRFTI